MMASAYCGVERASHTATQPLTMQFLTYLVGNGNLLSGRRGSWLLGRWRGSGLLLGRWGAILCRSRVRGRSLRHLAHWRKGRHVRHST